MFKNAVNAVLRTMGYETRTEICGHELQATTCSMLVKTGLWSETAIERHMTIRNVKTCRPLIPTGPDFSKSAGSS